MANTGSGKRSAGSSKPSAGSQMPFVQLVRLSLRLLRREARSGELTLIFFSLLLAMTLSTAISVFSARLDQAILDNAGDYLGAPLRVRSTEAFDEQWLKDAEEQGLRTARVVTFPSVVLNPPDVGDEMTLASVKTVDDGYPINSRLRVRFSDTGTAELQSHGPEPGNVWAEPRLLLLLGRNLGDQVEVGQGLKTITGVIEEESDRTGSFYNLSPRIMLHWQDVEGTPLLGPGSRTSYTLMLDGPDDALERYIEGRELTANQRVETLEDGNQALSGSVSRAREYLSLAALLAVILATVAITVSSGRFARRHLDTGALLRTFGLQKRQMAAIFMLQWLALFLLAWLSSALIALGLQQVIITLLASVVPEGLPSAPMLAWLTGPVTGLVCLVGFGLPQLRPLFNVTPLRVLRRDIQPGGMAWSSIMVLAVLTLFGVVTLFTGDWVLSASLVLGGGLISALLIGLVIGLIAITGRLLRGRHLPLTVRFVWQSVNRQRGATAGQVLAFTLTFVVMLLMVSMRTDLLDDWQQSLGDDTPNVFMLNIQPDQTDDMAATFQRLGLNWQTPYPILPMRLTHITGETIQSLGLDKLGAIDRDLNSSSSRILPESNEITAGDWDSLLTGTQEVSVEAGVAEQLNVTLGDTLTFKAGGWEEEVTITSLRKVDWSSMRPNFYMMFSPDVFADKSVSLLNSVHLPEGQESALATLIRTYPGVTFLDTRALLAQVNSMLSQITRAIELILIGVLAGAILVMLAVLLTTTDERKVQGALLRALGATREQVVSAQWAEFALLGVVSAVLALIIAEFLRWLLYSLVLQIPFTFMGWSWLFLPPIACLVISVIAVLMLRKTVRQAPLRILRAG